MYILNINFSMVNYKMGSLEEKDNKLFQNSITYLHNISSLGFNPPALKCLNLTKARLMELRKNIHLPTNATKTTVRCQRCFLTLIDGPASYKIRPEEKKSKFAKKMLAKTMQNKPLTKYQREYCKQLTQFNGNHLVIICKFCKKESLVKLEKPKKLLHPLIIKPSSGKRKKKRKDRFCGLEQKAVLSLTPQTSKQFQTSEFISLEASHKKFKLSRNKNLKETVKEVATKTSFIENRRNVKNKGKLKELLNTSSNKSSPSRNLKNFLQSL